MWTRLCHFKIIITALKVTLVDVDSFWHTQANSAVNDGPADMLTLFSSHIIFYLLLLISKGRKPPIDNMSDLEDPNR